MFDFRVLRWEAAKKKSQTTPRNFFIFIKRTNLIRKNADKRSLRSSSPSLLVFFFYQTTHNVRAKKLFTACELASCHQCHSNVGFASLSSSIHDAFTKGMFAFSFHSHLLLLILIVVITRREEGPRGTIREQNRKKETETGHSETLGSQAADNLNFFHETVSPSPRCLSEFSFLPKNVSRFSFPLSLTHPLTPTASPHLLNCVSVFYFHSF